MSTTEQIKPTSRPIMVAPASADQIPKSLLELPQWVNWKYVLKDGKWTKIPIRPNGAPASTTDPDTWSDFDIVLEASKRNTQLGVGFVFAKDGNIVGIDGDHCLDVNGNPKPWVQPIVGRFADTYIEISPSGTGLHVVCHGNLDGLVAASGTKKAYHDGAVEVYQHSRFFTVTGCAFRSAHLQIEEHRTDLEWLAKELGLTGATQGARPAAPDIQVLDPDKQRHVIAIIKAGQENDQEFAHLFRGGKAHHFDVPDKSHSEDDLAFCNLLLWGMGVDPSVADTIFRASGQMRKKWNEKRAERTYGRMTIEQALSPHGPTLKKYGVTFAGERTHAGWQEQLRRMFDVATPIAAPDIVSGHDPLLLAAEVSRRRSLPGFAESQQAQMLEAWEAIRRDFDEGYYAGALSQAMNDSPILSEPAPWPSPMKPEAFYGLAGRFVEMVLPHTEADPNFLLLLFLVYAGNVIDRRNFIMAGAEHYTNLFLCGVGSTSSGKKGSALEPIKKFFDREGPVAPGILLSGIASGEAMIDAVSDEIIGKVRDPKTRKWVEDVIKPAVEDKRMIITASEFASILQAMNRDGSTLSALLRLAWDGDVLEMKSKINTSRATGAHISVIGLITKEELLSTIQPIAGSNGLLNRFLWCCTKRSKLLPEGGRLLELMHSPEWYELQKDLNRATPRGRQFIPRDAEAADLWGRNDHPDQGMYYHLSKEDRHGLTRDATARAAQQVLRVALLTATLDRATEVRREHLDAAEAVWQYCEASAKFIFGNSTGDKSADLILSSLRKAPDGLTQSDVETLIPGNRREVGRALAFLREQGFASLRKTEAGPRGGRPSERWFIVHG